jgi:hypothetical protein
MREQGAFLCEALRYPPMPGKLCTSCFYVRRRSHFSRNVTHEDGKESRCRACLHNGRRVSSKSRKGTDWAEALRTDEPEWTLLMWDGCLEGGFWGGDPARKGRAPDNGAAILSHLVRVELEARLP